VGFFYEMLLLSFYHPGKIGMTQPCAYASCVRLLSPEEISVTGLWFECGEIKQHVFFI
jgi:hypothetical protein